MDKINLLRLLITFLLFLGFFFVGRWTQRMEHPNPCTFVYWYDGIQYCTLDDNGKSNWVLKSTPSLNKRR